MEIEIYEKCLELVIKNIKQPLQKEIIEILAISILALMLKNPKRTLEKMPSILQELTILADNRSVLEISHDELNNYQEDENLKYSDACVTRSLKINEETGEIKETKNLHISLKSENTVTLIQKTTHELTHLLRFKGIEQKGDYIHIKDGISIARFNLKTASLKRKHYHLEEGIVEKYTVEAMKDLYKFVNDNPSLTVTQPLLKKYVAKFPSLEDFSCYPLQTNLLMLLCNNKNFEQALEASFDEEVMPSSVSVYYNNVIGSPSAFSSLSKKIDTIANQIQRNETEPKSKELLEDIYRDTAIFLMKSKVKKY